MSKEVSKRKKATAIERNRRIFTVQQWIIENKSDHFMYNEIMKKWGLSKKQAERYIYTASRIWKDARKEDIEDARILRIEQLKKLESDLGKDYQKTPHGIRVKLQIKKEISKLQDLYPIKEKKVTHANDPENPLPQNQVIFFLPDNGRGDTYDQLKNQNT